MTFTQKVFLSCLTFYFIMLCAFIYRTMDSPNYLFKCGPVEFEAESYDIVENNQFGLLIYKMKTMDGTVVEVPVELCELIPLKAEGTVSDEEE